MVQALGRPVKLYTSLEELCKDLNLRALRDGHAEAQEGLPKVVETESSRISF